MAGSAPRPRLWATVARVALPLVLAGLVAWRVDLREVGARLARLDGAWLAAALALAGPLYLLLALRWRYTAARLGAALPLGRALREYLASTLLNQLLPLGVAGDVVRAARHRGRLGEAALFGAAGRAVVLERFSGLLVLGLAVGASVLLLVGRGRRELVAVGAGAAIVVVVALVVVAGVARRAPAGSVLGDAHRALWAGGAAWVQLALSVAVQLVLVAQFACAAHATGVALDAVNALVVVPLVLAATTLPWAFAGLGVREAAAAGVYALIGLKAGAGVAASLAFGLVGLIAAAPGLLTLVGRWERE